MSTLRVWDLLEIVMHRWRDMARLRERHLSSYKLVAAGRGVVWQVSDELAVDLTNQPGQHVIAEMVDILAAFCGPRPRQLGVVPLHRPTPGLAVDPGVRGGYPVIGGTRVPYDVVATLVDDGVAAEDLAGFSPSVGAAGARGAVAFACCVDEYRRSVPA